jgi:hypothetical protein
LIKFSEAFSPCSMNATLRVLCKGIKTKVLIHPPRMRSLKVASARLPTKYEISTKVRYSSSSGRMSNYDCRYETNCSGKHALRIWTKMKLSTKIQELEGIVLPRPRNSSESHLMYRIFSSFGKMACFISNHRISLTSPAYLRLRGTISLITGMYSIVSTEYPSGKALEFSLRP